MSLTPIRVSLALGENFFPSAATAHTPGNLFLLSGELSCISECVFQAFLETLTYFLAVIEL